MPRRKQREATSSVWQPWLSLLQNERDRTGRVLAPWSWLRSERDRDQTRRSHSGCRAGEKPLPLADDTILTPHGRFGKTSNS